MAVDVEELVINPFKEVVERGNEALANAEDAQHDDPELAKQMHKSAQAVVREGERALKRIQPLWDNHVDRYGDDFKESIRDNDEMAEKRRILEDMLYDFEDFIEDSTFDAEKFTELQAATKSLALNTLDIIKRLKIDKPSATPTTPATSATTSPATHTFPPLPPLPPMRSGTQSSRTSRSGTRTVAPDSPAESIPSLSQFPQPPTIPAGGGSLPSDQHYVLNGGGPGMRSSTGSRNNRMSDLQRTASSRASSVYSADSQPLQPRRVETWSSNGVPRQQQQQQQQQQQSDMPRQLHGQASMESHLLSPLSRAANGFPMERRPSNSSVLGDEIERIRLVGAYEKPISPLKTTPSPLPANGIMPRTSAWVSEQRDVPQQQRTQPRQRGESIPEDAAILGTASRMTIAPLAAQGRGITHGTGFTQAQQQHHQQHEYQPYTHNSPGPTFLADHPTSPATTNRTSLFSDTNTASTTASGYGPGHFMLPSSETRTSSLGAFGFEKETGGLATLPPVGELDDGLMLADETTRSETSGTQVRLSSAAAREAECMIGAKSTFHQLKGFCDGAEAFRKSTHSQGLRQANAYGESVAVSRCTSCEYYNIHSEVALDLAKDSRANFSKSNILYRLRFVIKSHIVVKNSSEVRFACLFCTQTGHTVREGDATVFQTLEALMRHLSRHPQPLPEVAGVTVLYGRVPPGDDLEEDYDLHFPDPPAPSPVPDIAFSTLPSATALKSHVRKPGEKALVDSDGSEDVLKFLAGARIVGVEFPHKWGGKWAVGWHDGIRSSFPVKLVDIEGPRQNEISLQSSSAVSVTAKWKWAPKDAGRAGWLVFDRGDTIRNVGWLYQDHWCWTGVNAKGKFGVFPSSHVDHLSIKETHEVKRPTTSKGGLFGLRRKSISTESSYS